MNELTVTLSSWRVKSYSSRNLILPLVSAAGFSSIYKHQINCIQKMKKWLHWKSCWKMYLSSTSSAWASSLSTKAFSSSPFPAPFSAPLGLFFLQNLQMHHPIRAKTTRTITIKMTRIILELEKSFSTLVKRSDAMVAA